MVGTLLAACVAGKLECAVPYRLFAALGAISAPVVVEVLSGFSVNHDSYDHAEVSPKLDGLIQNE